MADTMKVTLATDAQGNVLREAAHFVEGTLVAGESLDVNRKQGELMVRRGVVRELADGESVAPPKPKPAPRRRPSRSAARADPAPAPSEDPDFLE